MNKLKEQTKKHRQEIRMVKARVKAIISTLPKEQRAQMLTTLLIYTLLSNGAAEEFTKETIGE